MREAVHGNGGLDDNKHDDEKLEAVCSRVAIAPCVLSHVRGACASLDG